MKAVTDKGPYCRNGNCGWVAILSLLPLLALHGFSVKRAVADYQANHAQHYKCPYAGKTGSCSQLLIDQGPVTVLRKCKSLRAAQE